MRPVCTCVIPFFNEGARVRSVVRTALNISGVGRILCIDDGSTDFGWRTLSALSSRVTLLRLSRNQGKVAAVSRGVAMIRTPYTLLLDADLHGLRAREVERAFRACIRDDLDMVILRRVRAQFPVRFSRCDMLLSGERVIKTADLRCVLALHPHRYQLESAINSYMFARGKAVRWAPSSARTTLKIAKWGIVGGIQKDIEMYVDLLRFSPSLSSLRQMLSFCSERIAL